MRPRQERVPNWFLRYVFEQGIIDDEHVETVEYLSVNRQILAMVMHQIRAKISGITTVGQGIKKFGKHGKQAAMKELQQLHDRGVFKPVNVLKLTREEIQKLWRVWCYN